MEPSSDEALEILKLLLPAAIVFLTSFYLIKSFLKSESRRQLMEIKKAGQDVITPIRLQAYERIALFLERIAPENLLIRVQRANMNAHTLKSELLTTIRGEYEHNLSQQIYMSGKAWEATKTARNETVKLIEIASRQLKKDATSMELSKVILEMIDKMEKTPTAIALEYIKQEIRQTF